MSLKRLFGIAALAVATSGCVATVSTPGVTIHADPYHRRPVYGPVYGPVYRPVPPPVYYPAPRHRGYDRHHRYPGHHHR